MMKTPVCCLLLAVGMFMNAGCYERAMVPHPAPPINTVVMKEDNKHNLIVDLDAVARATGWDQRINQKVELATEDLNAQLLKAAQEMDADFKKQQAELGPNPTQAQLDRLKEIKLLVDQKIQSNKVIAQNARDRVRNEQVLLFRQEVKPMTSVVAKRRGAEMVLMANEEVVWYDPALDITGEVISEMRSRALSGSAETAAPASGEKETNRVAPPQDQRPAAGDGASVDAAAQKVERP